MNKSQYWAIVEEWKALYGSKQDELDRPKYIYKPSKVKATCKKCDKAKRRMARHHKANDFFFAMILPSVYAARYIQFHPDDVDKLCEKCHKTWHRYLKPKLEQMYKEYKYFADLSAQEKLEWCELWRGRCLRWYSRWIEKKPIIRKKRLHGRSSSSSRKSNGSLR